MYFIKHIVIVHWVMGAGEALIYYFISSIVPIGRAWILSNNYVNKFFSVTRHSHGHLNVRKKIVLSFNILTFCSYRPPTNQWIIILILRLELVHVELYLLRNWWHRTLESNNRCNVGHFLPQWIVLGVNNFNPVYLRQWMIIGCSHLSSWLMIKFDYSILFLLYYCYVRLFSCRLI